ncbi:nicotinate-nucleotide--dimethylbenzimidazole phosphoribosyltransferase [Jatrophihabitans sp.]|uniref:nicotinate-nucleotide--dimethylbenzimidazole phosphoribosyltransferase n=1 Tax=Jatrophihabitans sp. TaxID=1932789 RepID=UPI0030C6AA1F|nr:nicotinate-nucleotide--dimethylbenzimidazole phosphoribosyltransferase [Jatrophihabitans sp.]
MTDLLSLGADVQWPDHDRASTVRAGLGDTARLGRLAPLAEWVAGVHPLGVHEAFRSIHAVVIDGEPGAAASAAAEAAGVGLRIVTDLPDWPSAALEAGVALADAEADRGTDLLIVASPEVRADAALAVSVLTNTEPVKVLSRGAAATDPEAWMDLAVHVRDGRRRAMAHHDNADDLLTAIGSPRLALLAGLILRASVRRTPVVLDGPVACAAALVAYEAQPRAVRWWCAADLGPDPLHELALTRLGQQVLLGVGSGLGDGLAGMLAVPLLQAAARLGG